MALASYTTLRKVYRDEVSAELDRHPALPAPPITESDIAPLPAPVQRYFRASGFVGRPHTNNARIIWREMLLKRSRDASFIRLDCQQFNSVAEPTRIALMTSRIGGLIPFEGRDKYQQGHGDMRIKLLKIFTVGETKGRHMDESALVTVLSEALLAPSYALQGYLKWSAVDDHAASAELRYAGLCVRGTFFFNEADELIRFETSDRWQDGRPPKKYPWSAQIGGYKVRNGLRFPTEVSATWHEPGNDFTYVKGTIEAVEFNVGTA